MGVRPKKASNPLLLFLNSVVKQALTFHKSDHVILEVLTCVKSFVVKVCQADEGRIEQRAKLVKEILNTVLMCKEDLMGPSERVEKILNELQFMTLYLSQLRS